jgi:ferredoxin
VHRQRKRCGQRGTAGDCGVTMKVRIDKPRCTGNARCWAVAPGLYPLDDEGYISIEGFDVPTGQEELARRGARACPERVIEIVGE